MGHVERYDAFVEATRKLLVLEESFLFTKQTVRSRLFSTCKRICDLDVLFEEAKDALMQDQALVQVEYASTLMILAKWLGNWQRIQYCWDWEVFRSAVDWLRNKPKASKRIERLPKFLLQEKSYYEAFGLTRRRRPSNSSSDTFSKLTEYIRKIAMSTLERVTATGVLSVGTLSESGASVSVLESMEHTRKLFAAFAREDVDTTVNIIEGDPQSVFNFTKEDTVGRGSYGEVVKAESKQEALRGTFALKVVFYGETREKYLVEFLKEEGEYTGPETDKKELEEKLVKEAQMMSDFHACPFTIDFVGLYDFEDNFYLATSLCEFGSIRTLIKKRGTGLVEEKHLKYVLVSVLNALKFMHDKNVYHGDIKGDNILINELGIVQLCDFGNAYDADVVREEDSSAGTVHYMAPEIIAAAYDRHIYPYPKDKFNLKIDVWAVGITTIELYDMDPPMAEIKHFHLLNPIRDVNRTILAFSSPKESMSNLLDFVDQCLVKDVKSRLSVADLLSGPYLAANVSRSKEFLKYIQQ